MAEVTHEISPESVAEEIPQFIPTIYIPISKEQMDMLEVGENITLTLKGKIAALELHAGHDEGEEGSNELRLEMQSVKIDPKENDFSKLLDEGE